LNDTQNVAGGARFCVISKPRQSSSVVIADFGDSYNVIQFGLSSAT
jgi:hypothetical protein